MKFIIIAIFFVMLATAQQMEDSAYFFKGPSHRELARRRTTVRRTSSRSSSSRSSRGTYSAARGRYSTPVYVYYIRPNYYNAVGYYSPQYRIIYYDGYGYNFYYGKTGYYENSANDIDGEVM